MESYLRREAVSSLMEETCSRSGKHVEMDDGI